MSKIQPTNGRSTSASGGSNRANDPAPAGELVEMRLYRYPVIPKAAILMIVPTMIWSARTEIDSHAWTAATTNPDRIASEECEDRAGVSPKIGPGSLAEQRDQEDAGRPTDERRYEHGALDADVHDARALAEDAAQGGQGDRDRRPEDDRGDDGRMSIR